MNCHLHPNEPAVAQCADCGRGLCQTCASISELPLCPDCRHRRFKSARNKNIRYLVLMAIVFIIGYVTDFAGSETLPAPGMSGYMLVAFLTGLTLIGGALDTPTWMGFVSTSAAFGSLIMLLVKLVIALIIGLLLWPLIALWQLYKLFRNSKELKKADAVAEQLRALDN